MHKGLDVLWQLYIMMLYHRQKTHCRLQQTSV